MDFVDFSKEMKIHLFLLIFFTFCIFLVKQ